MYSAKIITDAGKTVNFGYKYGILFDISPLTGADVSIATSQGFQQIGTTVEGQSVGGIKRTIKGTVLTNDAAKWLLSTLPVFTTGKLYFDDEYFCDITVQKTPMISRKSTGKMLFTMQVYCDTPFWKRSSIAAYSLNTYAKVFSFPVTYDSHTFGTKTANEFVNVTNSGDVAVPLQCEFMADLEATNYGVINVNTLEEIRFDDTLLPGEKVTLFQDSGRIRVNKQTTDGTVVDYLGYLSYNSNLFYLEPGDNVLKVIADTGADDLYANISFYPAYMGVLP